MHFVVVAAFMLLVPTEGSPTIASGDSAFVRIDYPHALAAYQSVLRTSPGDAGAMWRIARVYNLMAEVVKRDQKEELYRKAETFARLCVATDSTNARGHTWLAVCLGNIAMFEGSKTKVQLANDIKSELDIALRLDPNDDVSYTILGSFYRALGNISWIERSLANVFLGHLPEGGFTESEQALKKAIELGPRVLRHQHELGMLYLDLGRKTEAKQIFEAALTLPSLVASDSSSKERIRKKLQGLE